MTIASIALLLTLQAPQQDAAAAKPSAGKLMSNMFAHYAAANTLSGTVKMTQTANGISVHTVTQMQFERPSKLYIRQVQDGNQPREWVVTSNGEVWTYGRPDNRPVDLGKDRYVEAVTQHGDTLTVPRFLEVASHSLGDVNAMVISTISSPAWLKRLTSQWMTLKYLGEDTIGGVKVHQIGGNYREVGATASSGKYEAFVTDDGEFLKYIVVERWAVPQKPKETVDVTTTWESDLKVGGPINPSLYRPILPH